MPDEMTTEDVVVLPSSLESVYDDLEQTQSALQEIDGLIAKNKAELERLAQRNAQVSNYVRQFQTHLDAVPSEVICEGYEALLNTRQRLVALRGRLDKLESDQHHLQRLAATQRRFLNAATEQQTPLPTQMAISSEGPGVRQVVLQEEAVRERVADKLRAGPIPCLSNLILQAELCQRLFDAHPERARAELAALRSGAIAAFSATRTAILDVRPMTLDEVGIVPAVMRYVETLQEDRAVEVSISITGEERRLPDYVEIVVFRGIQELLKIARAHRHATQLQLNLGLAANTVSVVVEDNGTEIVTESGLPSTSQSKDNLRILQERIELMGGAFQLQNRADPGTRVEFSLPIQQVVRNDSKSPIHEGSRE